MTKSELVQDISIKTGLSNKDVNKVLTTFVSTVTNKVSEGESVDVTGLMKFTRVILKGRKGIVPGTDTPYESEDKFTPRVKLSDIFKNKVNEVQI